MTNRRTSPENDKQRLAQARNQLTRNSASSVAEIRKALPRVPASATPPEIAAPPKVSSHRSTEPASDANQKEGISTRADSALHELHSHLSKYIETVKAIANEASSIPDEMRHRLSESTHLIDDIGAECLRQEQTLKNTSKIQIELTQAAAQQRQLMKEAMDGVLQTRENLAVRHRDASASIDEITKFAASLNDTARQARIDAKNIADAAQSAVAAKQRATEAQRLLDTRVKEIDNDVSIAEKEVKEKLVALDSLLERIREEEEALGAKLITIPSTKFWENKHEEHASRELQLRRALLWFGGFALLSLIGLCSMFYALGITPALLRCHAVDRLDSASNLAVETWG